MKSLKLRDNFYWLGIVDSSLRTFDIIMYTEFGTSYNSYLLKTGGKTVLFETAKAKFFDEYLEKIKELTDPSEIEYLVVNHTEPDHSGSVERLLELNPNMKIIGTGCALNFLKNIVNRDFYSIAVKDGDEMKIGDRTLRFMAVPNLHWPDTMYTYIEEEQILVTCDSFGSHYASEEVLRSLVKDEEGYLRAAKYYFDCILGPFKPYMSKALERVRRMDISMICPGHGPVLDEKIDFIEDKYEEWCSMENPNPRKTVIIPYVSAYGYTAELAERISAGIADSGPVDVRCYDLVTETPERVLQELAFADGMLFGTPTIVGEALKPIWDLTTSMFAATCSGKLASAFGSYGWSGEGVPHILERLRQLKLKVADGFRVQFKPGKNDLTDAYEYGYSFGCMLQNKELPQKSGAHKLVKCLVCGEIFDASLETCPVCGVGKEHFVPVDDTPISYRNDTDRFYVVLGNGSAGLAAASAIRERDKTGRILMLSNEPYSTYNRPMLTKSMLAGMKPEEMAVKEASWYDDQHILQLLGKEVTAIDTASREVIATDNIRFKYDRLIYALGSECFIPPIPGHDRSQVIAIRKISDTKRICELLPSIKDVVVIGGGVLGLEAAWELKKARCNVTVLELTPQLMGRQLDEGAGQMLIQIAESSGINIHTGVQISEIQGDPDVTGVKLGDGTVIPAQLVIVSCGVRANTAVAQASGIKVDRAVVVNRKMETNVPFVYACGDCAQFEGINYAIWPEALEQGRVAGANAVGDTTEYTGVSAGLSFHGMNTALYAIGDNGKNPSLVYRTAEFKDPGRMQYEKYYFVNGRLSGAILLGDVSKMAQVTTWVEEHAAYRKIFG